MLARLYARWCVQQIVADALAHFGPAAAEAHVRSPDEPDMHPEPQP